MLVLKKRFCNVLSVFDMVFILIDQEKTEIPLEPSREASDEQPKTSTSRTKSDKCMLFLHLRIQKISANHDMFFTTGKQTNWRHEFSQADIAVALRDSIEDMRYVLHQEEMLLQNITDSGLQVRSVHIPGDGNCLFHAISDQLNRVNAIPKTHVELRALAVEILQNPSNIGVRFKSVF